MLSDILFLVGGAPADSELELYEVHLIFWPPYFTNGTDQISLRRVFEFEFNVNSCIEESGYSW